MISINVEGLSVEFDGRQVTVTDRGYTSSTTISDEAAINIVMELSSTFPPPPDICGGPAPFKCGPGCC